MEAKDYELQTILANQKPELENPEILDLIQKKLDRARKLSSFDISGKENERIRIKLAEVALQQTALLTLSTAPAFYEKYKT